MSLLGAAPTRLFPLPQRTRARRCSSRVMPASAHRAHQPPPQGAGLVRPAYPMLVLPVPVLMGLTEFIPHQAMLKRKVGLISGILTGEHIGPQPADRCASIYAPHTILTANPTRRLRSHLPRTPTTTIGPRSVQS